MDIQEKDIFIYDGKQVREYTISNDRISVSILNIGATITKFIDLGTNNNIVLNYKDYKEYINDRHVLGSIVGRNAGRIQNGILNIDGRDYHLSKNFLDKHQLHGGRNGFHKKYFEAIPTEDGIKFTAFSEDGEEGFPGNVKLEVIYRLEKNELHLIYKGVSDQKTLLNFTNHSYFNLNLDSDIPITNHELLLNCDRYLRNNDEMIPTKTMPVQGTPLDFTKFKLIGTDIKSEFEQIKKTYGFDQPFLINRKSGINHVAHLQLSEAHLDVYSDQEAVVVYTGNYLKKRYTGICFETQGIPNSPHINEYKTRNLYDRNQTYKQHTIWVLNK
ncbi:aldose epimerase family protein [Haloplasma contractile]|uniref:Aldose 1-epimerase n=1 Tax=Haloplasma contractile SSD-17B TaxID=1033810 RepID=U2EEH2_9MOLU|nr:aldose epimerase family protein [Haloplasma contractile]ERJ13096.1 aldose 1-epimerase protein [Haloplasma contractile SSD-17B]